MVKFIFRFLNAFCFTEFVLQILNAFLVISGFHACQLQNYQEISPH